MEFPRAEANALLSWMKEQMRAVYPALYYPQLELAEKYTMEQGNMTHWDIDSDEACKLYADMIHFLVSEVENGDQRRETISERLQYGRYDLKIIASHITKEKLQPTGYVVDSLKCALYAFWNSRVFEAAVAYAANMGGDADTIAAICGGIAGAFYGFATIPEEWIAALSEADRARLDAAVDAAVESWQSGPYQNRTEKI